MADRLCVSLNSRLESNREEEGREAHLTAHTPEAAVAETGRLGDRETERQKHRETGSRETESECRTGGTPGGAHTRSSSRCRRCSRAFPRREPTPFGGSGFRGVG